MAEQVSVRLYMESPHIFIKISEGGDKKEKVLEGMKKVMVIM